MGAAEDGAALVQEGAAQGGEVVVVGVGGPEEDGGEGGGCVEFEAGVGVEESGEVVCGVDGAVDECGEAVAAEGAEGGGDLEGVGAAGGAQGAAEEVG